MNVESIMSTPVVFTQPEVKVAQLKDMFARKDINAVPVLADDGTITGIVTSSDLVACHDESLTVKEIMSDKVHVAVPEISAKGAAASMVKHDVHHLIVMSEGDVVGILSATDIMKVFAES